MDINVRVPAIEKLLDYAASGIGAVAGPMLASWKARREANAKLIGAKGEAEVQRISAEGQAQAMQVIANAQADARSVLISPDAIVQGQLDFGAAVTQRIQFQEEKKQANIGQVLSRAALELEGKDVPDQEPDHDWTARFFNDVQDVSSEEMQQLWAKVLAGEVERPASISIRSLGILRNLDQASAQIFQVLCSCAMTTAQDGDQTVDIRVPVLGGPFQALRLIGLSSDALSILNEHGLIRSAVDEASSSAIWLRSYESAYSHISFKFQERYWVLLESGNREHGIGLSGAIPGIVLTQAGKELSTIVECQPMPEYHQALVNHFASHELVMTEANDAEPHIPHMGIR